MIDTVDDDIKCFETVVGGEDIPSDHSRPAEGQTFVVAKRSLLDSFVVRRYFGKMAGSAILKLQVSGVRIAMTTAIMIRDARPPQVWVTSAFCPTLQKRK